MSGHAHPSRSGPSLLEIAKETLLIPEMAAKRGWEWQPSPSCPCPYRPDRNASGSVMRDGRLFHDFASGETMDAPALLAKVENLDQRTACKLFIELAGLHLSPTGNLAPSRPRPAPAPASEPAHEKPELPALAPLTEKERKALANLRGLSVQAVEMAHVAGFLHGLNWRGHRAWALTDQARWNAQWRRLDGGKWEGKHGTQFKSWGAKSAAIKRPRAGWPVGILEAASVPRVVLVEGGPDFLAALHFLHLEGMAGLVAPVCMFGSVRIDALALPHFTGKRVRIFPHADDPTLDDGTKSPGLEAAARWQDQLLTVGCTVDAFDFAGLTQANGDRVKDLCDLANLSADDFEAESESLSSLMLLP